MKNYSFEELYYRLGSVSKKDLDARIEGDYRKEILYYVKGFLEKVIVEPDIALNYGIEPVDIALVLDVYGINSRNSRLSQAELSEEYNMSPTRVAARFAVVVKTIKTEQIQGEDLGL